MPAIEFPTEEQAREYCLDLFDYHHVIQLQNSVMLSHSEGITEFRIRFNAVKAKWSVNEKKLFIWKNFEILGKFQEDTLNNEIWKYNIFLNEQKYFSLEVKQIRVMIKKLAFEGNQNLCNPFITSYLLNPAIKILDKKEIMGYTIEGLMLPSEYYFNPTSSDIALIKKNLLKTEVKKINMALVKKKFKILYNQTQVDYKEYIFSYWIASFFQYALKDTVPLRFFLELLGKGNTGKTSLMSFLARSCSLSYNNVIPAASFKTEPRANAKLTSSAFFIAIDEVESLNERILASFKTAITSDSAVQKLGIDQNFSMNRKYCTPCVLMGNRRPVGFDSDPQINQRILLLKLKNALKINEKWLTIANSFGNGELGKFILTKLKDIKFTDLTAIYKSLNVHDDYCEDYREFIDSREKNMISIMCLGAYFIKKWFDIDIIFKELFKISKESRKGNSNDIVEVTKDYFKIINDGDLGEQPNWITEQMHSCVYNGRFGFLITNNMLIDIRKRLQLKRNELSLGFLAEMLFANLEIFEDNGHFGVHVDETLKKKVKSIWLSDFTISTKFGIEKLRNSERLNAHIKIMEDIKH